MRHAHHLLRRALAGAALATWTLLACSSGDEPAATPQACVIGQSVACTCDDGRAGAQVCEDGTSLGPCVCTGLDATVDGGAPPDAQSADGGATDATFDGAPSDVESGAEGGQDGQSDEGGQDAESDADGGRDASDGGSGIGCSAFFGDSADQGIGSVVIDANGNVLVLGGAWWSIDLGGGPLYFGYQADSFMAKFDADCRHVWSQKVFGYSSIALDGNGNIFAGGNNGVGKFDAQGNFVVLRGLGGSVGTVATDGKGNVFATANGALVALDDSLSPLWQKAASAGRGGLAVDGSSNVFTLETTFTDAGALLWAVRKTSLVAATVWTQPFPNVSATSGFSNLALAPNGDPIIAGYLVGSADLGTGVLTSAGEADLLLARLSATDGSVKWARRYGGASTESVTSLAVTPSGNIVVGGWAGTSTVGASVAVDLGTGPKPTAGGTDLFLATYDANGAPLSATLYGDAENSSGMNVAVAGSGEIVVAGTADGDMDFGSGRLVNPFRASSQAFLARSPTQGGTLPNTGADAGCDAGTCGTFLGPANALPGTGALATNSTTVFWTDGASLQSCAKSGCASATTIATGQPTAVAANDAYLFWTDFAALKLYSCTFPNCAATTQVRYTFTGSTSPTLALDAINVYFLAAGKLVRCPFGDCSSPLAVVPNSVGTHDFAVAGGRILFADYTSAGAVTTPGGSVQAYSGWFPPNQDPHPLTSDGTAVYWADEGALVSCPVGGCPGGMQKVIASGPINPSLPTSDPQSVATDGVSIYWYGKRTSQGAYAINRCPVAGCAPGLPDKMDVGYPFVLDGAYLYSYISRGGQAGIWRTPK